MIIKDQNFDVNNLINQIDYSSFYLKDNGKGILLNNYQIDVLKRNGFDYQKYSNLNELIFEVDNYLNDGIDDEELEFVIDQIVELHYYKETNK